MIVLKSDHELAIMRKAGKILAESLQEVAKAVVPGVTLKELDEIAEEAILSRGAKPGFKGLYDFPGTICTAINEQVVHGIPGRRKLEEGDIIGIDIGICHFLSFLLEYLSRFSAVIGKPCICNFCVGVLAMGTQIQRIM